jgi:hypothetical protein
MNDEFGAAQVQAMLAEAEVRPTGVGDGTLFGEPVLAFAQIPTTADEGFRHVWARPDGRVLARAREKNLGPKPSADEPSWRELVDHEKTDVVAVTDPDGATLLEIRHLKHWKSRITVTDGRGGEVGTIRQKNITFKPSWELAGGGRSYGKLKAHGSRALGFDLIDDAGDVYGRMVKTGSSLYGVRQYHAGTVAGLPPKTAKVLGAFVLQFFRRPDHPRLASVLPLAVDLSMAMGGLSNSQGGSRS